MALTMTRTRTQTTLTKLAGLLANINGELGFVEELLVSEAQHGAALSTRRNALVVNREAVCLSIRQFNPALNPDDIGTSYDWLSPFGRKKTKATITRYLASK